MTRRNDGIVKAQPNGWRLHYVGDGLYHVVLFIKGIPIEMATKSDAAGLGPWPKDTARSVLAELKAQLKAGIRLEQTA